MTENQVSQYTDFVFPRIDLITDKRIQSYDPACQIIACYPKRSVSEIKELTDCNLPDTENRNGEDIITTAMLEYGDILMFGLKYITQDEKKAMEYYTKAAICDCEAGLAIFSIHDSSIEWTLYLRRYDLGTSEDIISSKGFSWRKLQP